MEHSGFEPLTPTLPVLCATNCANPGFLVIEFCSRCGQTCGQAVFLTTSACGGSACIAGVSRDCGHGIFWLERGASCSQIKRATNCATPRKEKPQQLGCCGVVGDERIELPRAESESAALPLCESPSGLCLGRLPSTLIYYSVPDGICQRLF